MRRKSLSLFGVVLIISLFFLQSCQSKPETKVLQRYFAAVKLDDRTTMGTMAMEPISLEYTSWEIVASTEDLVEPYTLPDLNSKELELKKKVEESVIITMNAKDEVDDALFEMENARTTPARRAARQKVDDLQAKYEEEYVKEGGAWKWKSITAKFDFITPFDEGWVRTPMIAME